MRLNNMTIDHERRTLFASSLILRIFAYEGKEDYDEGYNEQPLR